MRISGNFNTQSIINHHNSALNQLQKSFQKLSSGKMINQASDNISDFNKTTELDMRIRGLNTYAQNLETQKNYVDYKETAMGNMNDTVQRMRELKIASENGSNSDEDIKAMNNEFSQLQASVKAVYENSEFNTRKVFTNTYDGLDKEFRKTIEHTTLASNTIQDYSIDDIDKLLGMVSAERSRLGAESLGIEAATRLYRSEATHLTNEKSIRLDTDMAKESMNYVKASLKEQVSMSMLVHAKMSSMNVLELLK